MTDLQLAEGNYLKPNATGGYRISYSQLSAWSRCQLQKHYQDVAKADPEAPQPEWLSAMVYGSVIHTALHVLEQLHHEGRDDALEVAQRTFAYYWEPANLHELGLKITAWVPRTTWGGLNDRGKLALAEYYDLRLKKDKSKLLGLEYEFAVPIEVRGVEHTMYGFIDRLTIDRSNSKPYISCDDFKSGKQQTFLRYNQQGSAYCLDPETLIAVSDGGWRPIGELEAGDKVLAVDEELVTTDGGKRSRRWREADVQKVWRTRKIAYRLRFSDGQSLTASGDHRFLAHREGHWSWRTVADIAAQLANPRRKTPGIKVARALRPPVTFKIDYEGQDYCAGYLAGAQLGDGYMRGDVDAFPYWAIGVGEDDRALVDRVRTCASGFGVKLHQSIRLPDGRGWQRRPLSILRTNARSQVDVLIHMSEAQDSPAWRAGWLAGLYDTDGGLADKSLAFYQKDREVLHRVARYAADLGFNVTVHQKTATLVGDLAERYAFCQLIRPALARKIPSLDARTLNMHGDCRVVAIEEVGERGLVDITTSTGTFIAEGIVSHNCYATTKEEFWYGWPESGQGDLASFDHDTMGQLERAFLSHGYRLHDGQTADLPLASRRFRWINMQEIKFVDGGWRNERDYARLKLMIDAYVRANEAGIYSLTPSGSTCLYCPFRETCGGCGLPHENAGAP